MSKVRAYQAIVTKYLPATNFRGSRIKATAAAGSVIVSRDDSLGIEDNHAAAAKALVDKFGWPGEWHCGGHPNEKGYIFVCSDIGGPAFVTYSKREG